MGITGPGQQHLALAHRARTKLPGRVVVAPASHAPPCPASILGPARLCMGLSASGSCARLRSPHPSFLLPSLGLGSGRLSRPCLAPVPAPPVFRMSSPFSKERAPFACAPALVPHSSGGGGGGGRSSSKRRGGAATLSTPRPPRPFPPPPQPHFRDRSGASQAPPPQATIGYKVPEASPSHVKRALATPRAAD